jgi:hypothetical protein
MRPASAWARLSSAFGAAPWALGSIGGDCGTHERNETKSMGIILRALDLVTSNPDRREATRVESQFARNRKMGLKL